ncbi:hypothetical protein CK203_058208 [Vitis vinifera]|uniref:Uncharacterized protein n=1 Tax=Vitis vinifera TaxID=29760 RepID=A0A438H5X8_VITVI|nr:hypothetical protein CK203_058208 [Vitis vinifera]
MARTRGAKSSSPSNRKKSLRKEPVPDSAPEPSQPNSSSGEARRQSLRQTIPYQVRRSVAAKDPGSLAESLPVPSPVPSPAPQEKSQEPQAPLPSPKFHQTALEEVIGGQCYLSPQLRETWIVELGIPFRAMLRLTAFRVRPACPIIPAAEEVSHGALLAPRDFFYPRIATDFYNP